MKKLRYIVIGCLPGPEREYLLENLKVGRAGETGACAALPGDEEFPGRRHVREREGVRVCCGEEDVRWSGEELARFAAEECLFISADAKELSAAEELKMARIQYLPPECGAMGDALQQEQPDEKADLCVEGFEEVGMTLLRHVYERRHGIPWTVLETERCVVKEFSLDYLDALFELYAGAGMTDYLEPLYDYEKEKEYQKAYIEHVYGFYGYGTWIVCEKNSGRLIGRVGIEHREELGGEPELGYAIGVPYQRQGYALEVCRAVLAYIRDELGMTRLNCLIDESNEASVRLAVKLGFLWTGTMEVNGKAMERYMVSL